MSMEAAVIIDWMQVFVWAGVLTAAICTAIQFLRMPTDRQIAVIKECLLSWVVQAETTLGSGTGKVKLSEVYSKFVKVFPFVQSVVSFETFSGWVDESLDQMRDMLAQNKNLREVVGIGEGEKV